MEVAPGGECPDLVVLADLDLPEEQDHGLVAPVSDVGAPVTGLPREVGDFDGYVVFLRKNRPHGLGATTDPWERDGVVSLIGPGGAICCFDYFHIGPPAQPSAVTIQPNIRNILSQDTMGE